MTRESDANKQLLAEYQASTQHEEETQESLRKDAAMLQDDFVQYQRKVSKAIGELMEVELGAVRALQAEVEAMREQMCGFMRGLVAMPRQRSSSASTREPLVSALHKKVQKLKASFTYLKFRSIMGSSNTDNQVNFVSAPSEEPLSANENGNGTDGDLNPDKASVNRPQKENRPGNAGNGIGLPSHGGRKSLGLSGDGESGGKASSTNLGQKSSTSQSQALPSPYEEILKTGAPGQKNGNGCRSQSARIVRPLEKTAGRLNRKSSLCKVQTGLPVTVVQKKIDKESDPLGFDPSRKKSGRSTLKLL